MSFNKIWIYINNKYIIRNIYSIYIYYYFHSHLLIFIFQIIPYY